MKDKFLTQWEGHEPIFSKVKGIIHPGPPLKTRLSNSIYRLQVVLHRLQSTSARLEQRDKDFFGKCTEAQVQKDQARASMLASECGELRKMARMVLRSQLAIEQVVFRLETVRDFGDVAVQMAPVVGVVHTLKNQLMGVMPEVSFELGTIGDTLNNMVVEVGETTGNDLDIVTSGEESQKVMKEAGLVAEQHMTAKFPDLPSSLPDAGLSEKGV
ncbi:MAG: Snf7 family protein [Candidatus Bathyarchaeia archaeon]